MSTELSVPPPGELEADAGWVRERIVKMREHPERLAWIVLLSSFAVFMVWKGPLAAITPGACQAAPWVANRCAGVGCAAAQVSD